MKSSSAAIGSLVAVALALAACSGSGLRGDAQEPEDRQGISSAVETEQDPPGTGQQDKPDAADQPATDGESVGVDTTVPLPPGLTESMMPEIDVLIYELDGFDVRVMITCMTDAGYPQYEESWSESMHLLDGPPDPLHRDLMQTAPHTDEQARVHGMIGIRDIWPLPAGKPAVETYHRGYLAAQDACWGVAITPREPAVEEEVRDLSRNYGALYGELQELFANAIVQPLSDLLREQLACVKDNGYPLLDVAGALLNVYEPRNRPHWALILASAGVEIAPGGLEEEAPDNPDRYKPTTEEIQIIGNWKRPAYEPTASEIDFALAYVQCGQELGVLERFEQLQLDARLPLLAEYETRILSLRQEVEDLHAKISP